LFGGGWKIRLFILLSIDEHDDISSSELLKKDPIQIINFAFVSWNVHMFFISIFYNINAINLIKNLVVISTTIFYKINAINLIKNLVVISTTIFYKINAINLIKNLVVISTTIF